MPNLTPNLQLEKPLDNEIADIAIINMNMDKIDVAVAGKETPAGAQAKATAAETAAKAYADTKVASLVNSSPAALDTLNELAAALGNDANFATTITNLLAGKLSTTGKAADSDLLDGQHSTAFATAAQGAKADSAAIFKSGTGTYTDNDTVQTFVDAFCTINSLVEISITSGTAPQGIWTVDSAAGSFTITSTVAESADITFDYYIIKGGA